MSKIDPKKLKKVFTEDVLSILPSNKDINRGVANLTKANDPTILGKIAKATTEAWQDPNHRKMMKKVHAKRNQTEWKNNNAEANKWENRSEQAKKNVLASREKLKTDEKFQESVKKRTESKSWQKANKKASELKWKNPNNKTTCPHCGKTVANNVYSRAHGDKCKSK